jgi:adenine deaminase
MALSDLIAVARGQKPADLILKNARVVNVFSGEIELGDVAIVDGIIAGTGVYSKAQATLDLDGKFLAPGLINGHTHIESSMLDVPQYARAVVPHGTLGVVSDLHEIANVSGLAGLRYVAAAARRLPLDFYLMAPSCVPATHLETSGARLGVDEMRELKCMKGVIGLGEMMNYPGVLFSDPEVLAKLELYRDLVIDGHAPGVSGQDLNAYSAAGASSDHESVKLEEAREKLKRGMYVMIREGSSEKNLEALLPLVTDETYKRCLFVVDDRSCSDLSRDGDIDAVVRKAMRLGLAPVRAIQLATINAAERFGLKRVGVVAPGYRANLIVLEDLEKLSIDTVFYRGRIVARSGEALFEPALFRGERPVDTMKVKPFGLDSLKLKGARRPFSVIEVVPGQIITRKVMENVNPDEQGFIDPDMSRDLLKIVVVERHRKTGNIGRGLVKGFGLKRGALASSVAHDSHNIIAVGASDEDIAEAVKQVIKMQGGLVVVAGGKVLADLALPVAGLLSEKPMDEVVVLLEEVENAARSLGVKLPSAFATLSFLALPVIPELRLTDLGLVDVNEFKIIQT